MIIFFLILTPGLRQKLKIYMVKIYDFQVNPAYIICTYWCCVLSYFLFGNLTTMREYGGFLHINY